MAPNVTTRSGWITFAGIAALVAGGYNTLSGIAALADDDTVAGQASEVLYGIDLTAWGWFWLIVGVAQLLTGVLLFARKPWGLWLGVGLAVVSAVMAAFAIFAWPLWAASVLALNVLIIFGLTTHLEDFGL